MITKKNKRTQLSPDQPVEEVSQRTVLVNQFTNGILDPEQPMLGPVKDGGYIIANTAPGCWGPMITPTLRGGHEVNVPVLVEEADIGDAVAIYIEDKNLVFAGRET